MRKHGPWGGPIITISATSLDGTTELGDPAQKKRQRETGRNYRIQVTVFCLSLSPPVCLSLSAPICFCLKVPRTKIIQDYQENTGYVDCHNRFRQHILGLATVWKTTRWQTRVLQDIFGIALVDSYLLARKFMPK